METAFKSFTDQLPSEIHNNVPTFMGENVVLFKPQCYIPGQEISITDYHFMITSSTPPPIKVGNQIYQFRKGRLLLFTPDSTIMATINPPAQPYLALCVKKAFLEKVSQDVTGKSKIFPNRLEYSFNQKLLNLISNFEDEFLYKNNCMLMIESISVQLAIQLLREVNKEFAEERVNGTNHNYVNFAIDYMQNYYNTNITIDDICQAINLSPYHFIRVFKAQTGITPHEYLLQIRVGKAKEMLKKGDRSVQTVANLCGFINQGHFSTLFKKVIGITPSRYKKEYYIINR